MKKLFGNKVRFEQIGIGQEFIKENGQRWRKISYTKAVKIEHPGRGNTCSMRPKQPVWIGV